MAFHVAPPSRVRAMTSQLPLPLGQGLAPRTQPVVSLMNVAESGTKPRGTFVPTGPTSGVAVRVAVGAALAVGAAVALGVGVGVAVGPAFVEACEHAATSTS